MRSSYMALAMTVRSEAMELAATRLASFGVEDEYGRSEVAMAAKTSAGGNDLVTHRGSLSCDGVYCGLGGKDESVEGKRVDDEEFADVFGMGVSQHQCEQSAEGVADDGDARACW